MIDEQNFRQYGMPTSAGQHIVRMSHQLRDCDVKPNTNQILALGESHSAH